MLNSEWSIPYLHSVLPGSFHSLCTSPCTSCTHLQYLDFHLSISSVYVLYSSGILLAGNERMFCLISCLISSFNICTTMLISDSIICVNNVCSISLRAVENASLPMPSLRVKEFLHTSPFFLVQGINQVSRICCLQKISCYISIKLTLYIVADIVSVCQYGRCSHNNYLLFVWLSVCTRHRFRTFQFLLATAGRLYAYFTSTSFLTC